MSVIDVGNLYFKYDDKKLLIDANMRLFKGEHMVLVGPNGSGKTTLLKLITKNLIPDKGSIKYYPNLKIGYLDQHLEVNKHLTIKNYLLEVYTPLFEQEDKMNEIYTNISLSKSKDVNKDLNIASSIQEYLLESDLYKIKSLLSNIINGLGMDEYILDFTFDKLSGGMREKVMLGKLLLGNYDCLLLDEPTNFLDEIHIKWLTTFLKETDKTFMVVSHDEVFLQNIADVVIAIENNKLVRYKGTYQQYLDTREIKFESTKKAFVAQQKDIKTKQEFVEKNIVRASTSKRAKSVRKALAKLDIIEKPTKPRELTFNFPFSSPTGKEVLKLNELVIGYNKPLLNPITTNIYNGDIVVIRGYNGIGKSTFIKTILNLIDELDGTFKWADTAQINYFSQDNDLDDDLTSFEHLYYEMDVENQKEVYNLLAQYGVTYDQARREFKSLSGGQQTKVRLALLGQYKSNILVLDEPTTHLDYNAKKALKQAITNFPGTTILVTHEKEFYEDLDCIILDFQDL